MLKEKKNGDWRTGGDRRGAFRGGETGGVRTKVRGRGIEARGVGGSRGRGQNRRGTIPCRQKDGKRDDEEEW